MTMNDAPVPTDGQRGTLELLTDEGEVWTAVPVDASGDDRVTKWISVAADDLCELSEWR